MCTQATSIEQRYASKQSVYLLTQLMKVVIEQKNRLPYAIHSLLYSSLIDQGKIDIFLTTIIIIFIIFYYKFFVYYTLYTLVLMLNET